MKRSSFATMLVVMLLASCSSAKKAMQAVNNDIKAKLAEQKGTYAVAYKNLQTGEEWGINDRTVFHAASTMKTPVMYEVYRQAAAGKFSMDDSIVLKNEFKSIVDGSSFSLNPDDDSETELYKHIGEKRTIGFLVYQMIIVSSNFATNLIIELVGAENVTKTMRELGIMDMQVLRGVEDGKAFAKGLNNTTTAHDLLKLFDVIAKNKGINKQASAKMISILLDQHFNEIIPAQLPADIKVAHKTGWITGVQHDGGIIILPDGRKYILVLLAKGIEDEKAAVKMMADVSGMVYRYFVR
jgi:beta-lactamase class A